MVDERELLTITEASVQLKRCYSVTRDLLLRGQLGGVQIGRTWYVKQGSVAALLAEQSDRKAVAV